MCLANPPLLPYFLFPIPSSRWFSRANYITLFCLQYKRVQNKNVDPKGGKGKGKVKESKKSKASHSSSDVRSSVFQDVAVDSDQLKNLAKIPFIPCQSDPRYFLFHLDGSVRLIFVLYCCNFAF